MAKAPSGYTTVHNPIGWQGRMPNLRREKRKACLGRAVKVKGVAPDTRMPTLVTE